MMISAVLMAALVSSSVLAYDTKHSIHGVRSSFLLGNIFQDKFSTSLMYLSKTWNNTERLNYIARLKNNGDTHIDVYARASSGALPGGIVDPNENLHAKLKQLNDNGLKPVLWMTGEQRQGDYKKSQAVHEAFIDKTIAQSDDQVAAYVVCLECDEFWDAATVNHYVNYIKARTDKPVAVHLAPGVGGYKKDRNYYKNADYIFLQIGDHTTGDYVADVELAKSMLAEALTLGVPVIANEYALYSETAQAKALGDLMCQMGAVGTGNGRNITFCGAEEAPKKNRDGEYAIYAVGIIAAAWAAYYLHTNYDFKLKLQATDNYQIYGLEKSFNLTERGSVNLDMETYVQDDYENPRVLVTYQFSW